MRFFWLAMLALYPVSASAERLLDLGEIRFNHNSGSSYNGGFSSAPSAGSTARFMVSGSNAQFYSGTAYVYEPTSGFVDVCPEMGAAYNASLLAACVPFSSATGAWPCDNPSYTHNNWSSSLGDSIALSMSGVSSGSSSTNCSNLNANGTTTALPNVTVNYHWCGADQSPKKYMQADGTCTTVSNGSECPEGTVEQGFRDSSGGLRSHCGPALPTSNFEGCTFNGDGTMSCAGDPEVCDDPMSIYDGRSICASEKNACTKAGGTFGFAGSGAEMNALCIPFDDAEQIPTCADLSAPVQNPDNSWRCLSSSELEFNDGWLGDPNVNPSANPDDNDGDGIPNAVDETPDGGYIVPGRPASDIDGDGIPDIEDSDMDGDGINNGSDDDADGDGLLNEDDPTPDGDLDAGTDDEIEGEGEGETTENEVSGGVSCDVAPTCSGDAAACSVVIQSWKTRCAAEDLTEEIGDSADGGIGDANTASNSLIDTFEQTALASLGESSGLVAADGLGDSLSNALGFSYSCQDWVFSYQSISASITCADTAPLRTLLASAFGIFTLIAVFQIATRSPE